MCRSILRDRQILALRRHEPSRIEPAARKQIPPAEDELAQVILKTAEREVRSIAYQIKAARFPAYNDLAGFDFASSEVNEALVALRSGAIRDRTVLQP